MPPKEKKYKGGLFDPSSVSLQLMKTSEVSYLTGNNPTTDANAKYLSRNYMNVPNVGGGGKKAPQKKKKLRKKSPPKKREKIKLENKVSIH